MTLQLQTGHEHSCPVFDLFQTAFSAKGSAPVRILSPASVNRLLKLVGKEDLKSETDAALVGRMGEEPDALACIYDRYASLVYAIALRVVRDNMAAEDIVNDVFLQLWRNPAGFDERRGKLASWLTVITRNRAVDQLRKRRITADVPVEDAPPSATATPKPTFFAADFEKAQRIMSALPNEQRKALELAYLDGLTQSEISSRLGEPLGTVKSRIRLGLSALRKALA